MYRSQLQTILWLRWRLTRNQWSRTGRLSVGISIAVSVLLLALGLGGALGGLVVGIVFGQEEISPEKMLAIYDVLAVAFVVFWVIGVVSTIQRSESIDIGKILHLPVSLKGIFVLNYLASHATPSIVVFVPWMLGLALGLAVSRGWLMLLMVPLTFGFLFMLTAWTYYLRGWLVILMRNPRRYRAMVAGITMTFVLLAQLPNLLMHLRPRESRSARQTETPAQADAEEQAPRTGIPPALLLAHKLAPPLWVGNGAMALATGNSLPALLAAAASFGIGSLGLACAYRSTRRFYEGRTEGKKAKSRPDERIATAVRKSLLEWKLPGLSEEAGAMALASLQSLRRATEVKMALAHNVLMLLIFGGMALFSHRRDLSLQAQFFYSSGIALLPFMGMIFLMTNQFGFDRAGFRTLVLSPMPRARILLGKNLALLPVAVALGSVYLVLAAFMLHLEAIVVAAALAQLVAAFFLLCIPANLISSLLPYRVREGALAATKVGAARALLNFLAHMGCMAILSLVLLPAIAAFLTPSAHGLTARLVYLGLSLVELAAIVAIYGSTLSGVGEVLLGREKEILRVVTQEVE